MAEFWNAEHFCLHAQGDGGLGGALVLDVAGVKRMSDPAVALRLGLSSFQAIVLLGPHSQLHASHRCLAMCQRKGRLLPAATRQEAVAVAQPKTSQRTEATPFLGNKSFVLVSQTHCGCLAHCNL
jgi:hypothetical protein